MLQMVGVYSFSVLRSTPLCEYTTTYPALVGHLGHFQFVVIMSNAAMSTFGHVL